MMAGVTRLVVLGLVIAVAILAATSSVEAGKKKRPSRCSLPAGVTGPCRGAKKRFTFNSKTGECEEFNYGGCKGNRNRFLRKKRCERRCIKAAAGKKKVSRCSLPAGVAGPCRAIKKRFTYNSATGQCEEFNYGGCRGNSNRFPSKQRCEKKCKKASSKPAVCEEPKVVGRCRAAHQRFYYDSAQKKCVQFIYGGCGGNGNNFLTLDACNQACAN